MPDDDRAPASTPSAHAEPGLLRDAMFRALHEGPSGHAMLSTDRRGLIREWSAAATSLMHWRSDEVLGRPLGMIFSPEDRAAGEVQATMRHAVRNGHARRERWHMRGDGTRFRASGSLTSLRGPDGRLVGFLKVLLDRTAECATGEALRLCEERHRLAALAPSDARWEWDLDTDQVHWSGALAAAYGHRPQDGRTDGTWWIGQIHPQDRERVREGVRAALEGADANWGAEYRFTRGDGSEAYVLDRGFVLRDSSGRPVRMIGAMLDLSDRHAVQVRLQASEDRLRLATDAARLGTFEFLPPARQFSADARCHALFGLAVPAEGTGSAPAGAFVAALHPLDRDRVREVLRESLKAAGPHSVDLQCRSVAPADGTGTPPRERWLAVRVLVFLDEGVATRMIGAVLDITDRVRADRVLREMNDTLEQRVESRTAALRRAEEQLRQAQKMEAVGQLTGGLAHDFNNLLTGIGGALEMMQTRLAQGRTEQLGRYIAAAQEAAGRAARLTHRLLAFSRRQTLDPKPTVPERLVEGMRELIVRTMGPKVVVVLEADPEPWRVLCDAGQLENAVLNLCTNARDAMPDGGVLRIECRNAVLEHDQVRDAPAGEYVAVRVTDTGAGMAPEVMARAFDPFFTTKPIGLGTGLGLSMIYGFVKQSGGQVGLASDPGQGTAVELCLPRHRSALAPPAPVAAAGVEASAGVVLLVDDEPSVRMLLGETLAALGLSVIEAADGTEGLRVLESPARVDVLVSDVGLPGGLNGRQLADRARVLRPGLPVLLITGYAEAAVLGEGTLAPGMEVVTKPFSMAVLGRRIAAALGRAAP